MHKWILPACLTRKYLVWSNVYIEGLKVIIFKNKIVVLSSLKVIFVLRNIVDSDQMQPNTYYKIFQENFKLN